MEAPFHSRSTPKFSPASAHLRSCSFQQLGKYLSSFCSFPLLSPPRCHSSHLDKLSTHHQPVLCPTSTFSSIVSPGELVRLTLPYPATHTRSGDTHCCCGWLSHWHLPWACPVLPRCVLPAFYVTVCPGCTYLYPTSLPPTLEYKMPQHIPKK